MKVIPTRSPEVLLLEPRVFGDAQLEALAAPLGKSGYGNYLLSLLRDSPRNA
jgi:hypothetical protein